MKFPSWFIFYDDTTFTNKKDGLLCYKLGTPFIHFKNDLMHFHNFVRLYTSDNFIIEFIAKHNITKEYYEKYVIKSLAAAIIISQYDETLMTTLIKDYEFVPDDEFMYWALEFMNEKIFFVLCNYIDIAKYQNYIHHVLKKVCSDSNLDAVKKICSMGFDVNVLNNTNDGYLGAALCSATHNPYIVKYLLDAGVEFKKYEYDILNSCLARHNETLKLLITYGADINILKNSDKPMPEEYDEIYDLLESYGFDGRTILRLVI